METSLKNKIVDLRIQGKTYNEISTLLNCSKATISYHCNNAGVSGYMTERLSSTKKIELCEYYQTHTLKETAKQFNVSTVTVVRHTNGKTCIKLTVEELKDRNYKKVKSHRQKIKDKAIAYKGGKCVRCQYDKCNRALEFHHLDSTQKDFGISNYTILSWDKIKIELDKCILVCANCHREIHDEIDNGVVTPLPDTQNEGNG
jgi:hypothetical protein